jgi:hypothetical protein
MHAKFCLEASDRRDNQRTCTFIETVVLKKGGVECRLHLFGDGGGGRCGGAILESCKYK